MHLSNAGQLLTERAKVSPQLEALVDLGTGCRLTFRTMNEGANQISHALAASGLKPGDRLAVLMGNCGLYVQAFYGAAKAGLVFVALNWRLTVPELSYQLADCGARAVIYTRDQLALVEPLMALFPDVRWLAIDDGAFAIAIAEAAQDEPTLGAGGQDPLFIMYTSGTTGKPKGAVLSHANGTQLRWAIEDGGLMWMLAEPGESVLNCMPFAHIAGIGTVTGAIYSGQLLVITREFDPAATLDIIERFSLGRLFLVPAALGILLQHPKAATTDFSSIRTFSYGASPIPLDLLKRGVDVLQCDFAQMYGMTETWGTVVMLPPEDHRPDRASKMTSAGKALPGVELAILDEDGKHLPPGSVGEVAIKSPTNMIGYWNKPEETAKTLLTGGWLRTGDAGILDEEGYLFIQDRMKDMIITGAENVYPAEVESAIYGHPHVADVAVIGVPDEKWGEAVKAIVVAKPGTSPDAADIIAFARQRIAGFKCPKSIDFIDALPRNPSGKILRRSLREPYWADRERRVN